MNSIKTNITKSIYKALIGVFFFTLAYNFFNNEFIREKSTDFSFDIFNEYWFSSEEQNSDAKNNTGGIVFYIDDDYLNDKDLLNNHGNKDRYGYFLPRTYIANFINDVDKKANKNGAPIALFIDFDIQFTSSVYNKSLSEEDISLLKALTKDRNYPIILVKNSTSNFIEQLSNKAQTSEEKELAKKIKYLLDSKNNKKKIFLAETSFFRPNKDNITRTYLPYKYYEKKLYYSFAVIGWQLSKNGLIDKNEIDATFDKKIYENINNIYNGKAIIDSSILIKDSLPKVHTISKDVSYQYKKSKWKNLELYSANAIDSNISNISDISNKIIMLGVDSTTNEDIFSVSSDYIIDNHNSTQLSGIEMHAHALMTILFLDGNLKKINPYLGALIVFIVFFIVNLTVQIKFSNFSNAFKFLISLFLVTIMLLIFSILLFSYEKEWFNWSFPILFLYAEELYEFIRRYLIKRSRIKPIKSEG